MTKLEVDELRKKLSCEYTEKLHELEMQNKIQKDELKKRDTDIKELTSENVKTSNDYSKQIALLEQERDFLKNDLGHFKDNIQRKEMDGNDISKQLREKEEKLKNQK